MCVSVCTDAGGDADADQSATIQTNCSGSSKEKSVSQRKTTRDGKNGEFNVTSWAGGFHVPVYQNEWHCSRCIVELYSVRIRIQ